VTSPTIPRFVLDTNVCLDLFVFGDPQCVTLLEAVHARRIELITRDDCREEWLAVLAYPKLAIEGERRAMAVQQFDEWVNVVRPSLETQADATSLPRCRDRDDQKFLELAHQGQAVALLTRDDALLKLARRAKRDGLFAILPPAAWREVMADAC
jgi:uncharacterized protein